MTSAPALCAWDLDGTLVDTLGDICFHVNATLKSLGMASLEPDSIRIHIGHGARELVAGCTGLHGQALHGAVQRFEAGYQARPVVTSVPFAGAVEALRGLQRRNVRSVVVTNKPQAIAEQVLNAVGLMPSLAGVFGARPELPLKPHPALFQAAVSAAGGPPLRAVVVGDSVIDWQTAQQAQVGFVGVSYGIDQGAGLRAAGVPLHHSLMDASTQVATLLDLGA